MAKKPPQKPKEKPKRKPPRGTDGKTRHRDLRDKGKPGRHKKTRAIRGGKALADIVAVEITSINAEGDAVCVPVPWEGRRVPPHIVISEGDQHSPAPGVGDRVLVRLTRTDKHAYRAHIIKALAAPVAENVLGIYSHSGAYGVIQSVNRREKQGWYVEASANAGAKHGELVAGETLPAQSDKLGMKQAKVTEKLGDLTSARSASIIAIHLNELPMRFSDASIREAESAKPPVMEPGRVDLRKLPLVTIDGEDARDFDDAVFAEPAPEGFHLVVAIADVAYYVKDGSALDRDAFTRGNSVYFPDRVIPMLPEALSNGLCSLKPDEDRYCVGAHIWIDREGRMLRYRFERALMRSHARLTYTEAQKRADAGGDAIVTALYDAYRALGKERDVRGALSLTLPEYKVQLGEDGNVRAIAPREGLESHRLIEAFMVAANVAAADFLITHKAAGIFRVHESPDETKLADLRALLEHMGYRLSKGDGVRPQHFNKVLERADGKPDELIVHQSVLRAQMQAFYGPKNQGHFGLGLTKYCHFTSPIRRYADLIVHRELVRLIAGDTELPERETMKRAASAADHISVTERKAMQAERDAMDRYRASFMSDKVGDAFHGVITGMNDAGLYVTLPENGVTGFVPIRTLGQDFFHYDRKHGEMHGTRTRARYALGEALMIRVEAASGATGNLIFIPDRPMASTQGLTRKPHIPKHKRKHQRKKP